MFSNVNILENYSPPEGQIIMSSSQQIKEVSHAIDCVLYLHSAHGFESDASLLTGHLGSKLAKFQGISWYCRHSGLKSQLWIPFCTLLTPFFVGGCDVLHPRGYTMVDFNVVPKKHSDWTAVSLHRGQTNFERSWRHLSQATNQLHKTLCNHWLPGRVWGTLGLPAYKIHPLWNVTWLYKK